MCVRERTGVRGGTERERQREWERRKGERKGWRERGERRREREREAQPPKQGKRGVPPVSHTRTLGGHGEVQAEERMEGGQRGGTWWTEGTGEHGGNEESGKSGKTRPQHKARRRREGWAAAPQIPARPTGHSLPPRHPGDHREGIW